MKKLHFNSTLNHKASDYKPYEICVERVVRSMAEALRN